MTKYKDFAVEYKDGEKEDGGYIVAYASTFDRDPDAYGDIVAKGAFLKSLAKHEEENNPIQFLFGHRTDDPMYNIGSVIEAKEDDHGLLIKATFDPDNEKAQYARKLVQEGRLKKLSFAFDVLDEGPIELEDGTKCNELRELEIYEVSLVPIPANEHAQVVEVKDYEVLEKAGRVLSAKNQDDIEKAVALLNGVLSQLETAASDDSQETPEKQKEGDPSIPEASEIGGKGTPAVDEDFLAKFRKYTETKKEK